jgi:hypothetical protein
MSFGTDFGTRKADKHPGRDVEHDKGSGGEWELFRKADTIGW